MEQALALARLALGQVSPNPAVGAVIVRDGRVVGQGYTQPPGSDHAEIVALRQAGEAARGGTLFVTLEPCCHFGRTPPCTRAIIDAGVAAVHIAMLDPNPQVAGKGAEELRQHGIETHVGEGADEAAEIVEAYTKFITTGTPFVIAKFAMSLDGKIASRSGDSRWISSEESRRYVHSLRHAADAIMVGVETILADDPRLTRRSAEQGGTSHTQPLRVVADARGRTPLSARVFHEPGSLLLALGTEADPEVAEGYRRAGAMVVSLPSERGLVDLEALLRVLGERRVTSVLVEGGGRLLGSLFDRHLVDKVTAFVAPVIIGGARAPTPVAGTGALRMADAIRLEKVSIRELGRDVMITGYVTG